MMLITSLINRIQCIILKNNRHESIIDNKDRPNILSQSKKFDANEFIKNQQKYEEQKKENIKKLKEEAREQELSMNLAYPAINSLSKKLTKNLEVGNCTERLYKKNNGLLIEQTVDTDPSCVSFT